MAKMWWTAENSVTRAHYDEYENILCVVQVRVCSFRRGERPGPDAPR
jgi:hypothetical protein